MSQGLLFAPLLDGLRMVGIRVAVSEWLALMEALAKGALPPSLDGLYYVGRALLVKDEALFDDWDQVFVAVYGDGHNKTPLSDALLAWLERRAKPPQLSPDVIAAMQKLSLDRVLEAFRDRLREQREEHNGGSRWIGTGGTSPFGHSGFHPSGIRVGGGGQHRQALQVAGARQFRQYRADRILDTRSLAVALKKLRKLSREHGEPELDIDETIERTSQCGGELDIILRPPRKNQARVLLLLDVGGSMDPYAPMVERLFSAAARIDHWRRFAAYSFHNCPYDRLTTTGQDAESVPTHDVLSSWPRDTHVVFVGDASMAPSELTEPFGAIDYEHMNQTPGLAWLGHFRDRFSRCVWLNPLPPRWWGAWSLRTIGDMFSMFPLTVDGVEQAVEKLRKPGPSADRRVVNRRGV